MDAIVGGTLQILSNPGVSYEVLYVASATRALIRYEMGSAIFVDQAPNGDWDLSGIPAEGDEGEIVKKFAPAMGTTEVDIVKDDP